MFDNKSFYSGPIFAIPYDRYGDYDYEGRKLFENYDQFKKWFIEENYTIQNNGFDYLLSRFVFYSVKLVNCQFKYDKLKSNPGPNEPTVTRVTNEEKLSNSIPEEQRFYLFQSKLTQILCKAIVYNDSVFEPIDKCLQQKLVILDQEEYDKKIKNIIAQLQNDIVSKHCFYYINDQVLTFSNQEKDDLILAMKQRKSDQFDKNKTKKINELKANIEKFTSELNKLNSES